ncbi:GntR family transcriptional regulator [Pseudomonas sp. NFACC36]|uniref:GntR family transcriptional regulator n=1 Tax=Pseudomonas sp. NFACC36 TaxID=1566197 RepID=UPI00091969F4|nr:GntR family transcriptional regulator [Pseudomonas sp. NFACC36]SFX20613.1 DNA-binding transcriptional regulator, GntR family [Pseudomonas sp. NFACC36]
MNIGLSLADQITLELRADIIGGGLLPGMALVENDLVSAYSASRNTIREALHRLGQEGLARYVRNKGVMVRRLDSDDVRDLFKVRRTLELQAIMNSQPLATYRSDRMLDALDAAELAREREDWRVVGTHSLAFHQHIVGLLGSPLLDDFFTNVVAQLRLAFFCAPDEPRFQAPWLARDRQIHDWLAEGNKHGAHEAMSVYLDDSEQMLLHLLSSTSKN